MIPEKNKEVSTKNSNIVVVLTVIILLIGVIIAIPIIYSTGRDPGQPTAINVTNETRKYVKNECTDVMTNIEPLYYLSNQEPFPFKIHHLIYRPSVKNRQMTMFFGFRHDTESWSLDNISVVDTTTDKNIIRDEGFESNYLRKNYDLCILSDTRETNSDILFDNPFAGDFYFNDQTKNGMTYLKQTLDVTGGRYYNISFYLENRGYALPNNTFILIIGT